MVKKQQIIQTALGRILATPGVLERTTPTERTIALTRHVHGDWGDVCGEDWPNNDRALRNEGRLLSAYRTADGTKFWIITEADRSATTILPPEEY